MEAKTLLADVCVFGHFGWLSPAAVHSADCQFDSEVKWWIHVSSIVIYLRKISFLLHWNSCKQCSKSLMCCFFDRLWANAVPTLSTAFSLTNVHSKWWIHCLLISSTPLLSHQLQFMIDQNLVRGVFGVFRDNCQIWVTWVFSIICVCLKSAYHLLTIVSHRAESEYHLSSHCFAWTVFFPIRKQCFINTWNLDCFENLQW